MFRPIRYADNALPKEDAIAMLEKAPHGTLAVLGDDDYPYSVPISFAYKDNKIYFHGAAQGHKLDSIKKQPKVSFSVIEQDNIVPETYNTLYRSAVAFGKARILTDADEKRAALRTILEKYSGDFLEGGLEYVESAWDQVVAVEIEIEHVTAKHGQ